MSEKNPNAYGYARMPRIIRKGYKVLTHQQKLFYIYLRDLCGEDDNEGTCYRSIRSLAKETGFSTGFISNAIPILRDQELIYAEVRERDNDYYGAWEVWHIQIIDIWKKNADFIQAEKEKRSGKRSSDEQSEKSAHQMNKTAQQMNTSGENRSSDEQNRSQSGTLQRTNTENDDNREEENENYARSSNDSHATHTIFLLVEKAIKLIQRKGVVNFSDLEKYLSRYMEVKGKVNTTLNAKNAIGWTDASDDFFQVVMELYKDSRTLIEIGTEDIDRKSVV